MWSNFPHKVMIIIYSYDTTANLMERNIEELVATVNVHLREHRRLFCAGPSHQHKYDGGTVD